MIALPAGYRLSYFEECSHSVSIAVCNANGALTSTSISDFSAMGQPARQKISVEIFRYQVDVLHRGDILHTHNEYE